MTLKNCRLSAVVLFLLGTHFAVFTNAGPTLAPPSTFGPEPSTTSSSASSALTTPRPSSSTQLSVSSTLSASTAFPSLGGYPPCVTNCLALAASAANCTSVIDVNCYCKNHKFADSIVGCIAKDCPDPQTLSLTESLAQQFCNLANSSASVSFPSTSLPPSASASASSFSTATFPTVTTSAAPTSATSNAAILSSRMPHDIIGLHGGYSLILALLLGAYII